MSETKTAKKEVKTDFPVLIKWAEEYQPCYCEKLQELEAGNKIVTVAGVQIPAKMFLKSLKHAMKLFKNKKLDSRYKADQKVLAEKAAKEAKVKEDAQKHEERRRKQQAENEAKRKKVRDEKRAKRIAEQEKALQELED